MNIIIKAVRLDLTPSIKTYINEKLGTLSKYIEKFNLEGQPELWLEVTRTTRHHQKGLVFNAKADLRLPGKVLRAVHDDADVRLAIDRVRDALKVEIEKYKTKKSPLTRRTSLRKA